jgi:hypothetical protein
MAPRSFAWLRVHVDDCLEVDAWLVQPRICPVALAVQWTGALFRPPPSMRAVSRANNLSEVAQAKKNVREYLVLLERKNLTFAKPHQQDKVSTTDPDASRPPYLLFHT